MKNTRHEAYNIKNIIYTNHTGIPLHSPVSRGQCKKNHIAHSQVIL